MVLASLISAELGRVSHVLPIGRTTTGTLIVAARDPAPALRATLEKQLGPVTLVITPAMRLEQLIAAAYGESPHDEFDIDLDSAVDLTPLSPMSPPTADVDMLEAASAAAHQGRRHRRVAQGLHQFSRRTALSCQRCSTSHEMKEVTPKMATPVAVSRISAA